MLARAVGYSWGAAQLALQGAAAAAGGCAWRGGCAGCDAGAGGRPVVRGFASGPAPAVPDVPELVAGILEGRRLSISRGITLCESTNPAHQLKASQLLLELQRHLQQQRGGSTLLAPASNGGGLLGAAHAPDTFRVGVSGPPGAGKSSLIESLGCVMVEHGDRVAVLAVDPSSEQSGGAILGDKTRMPRLSASPTAFVRPSPARGTMGGVARATSDAIVICEAAGFSRVLVETVGVGQNETAVVGLVDCLLLVMPPVGGDELQVIKRGITEMADIVAVNKADGPTRTSAAAAAAAFKSTMHFHRNRRRGWSPTVLTCSAHTGFGVEKLRRQLEEYRLAVALSGELAQNRQLQRHVMTWAATEEAVLEGLRTNPHVKQLFQRIWPEIKVGSMAPRTAADLLAQVYAEFD